MACPISSDVLINANRSEESLKTFTPDQNGQVEINDSTMLRNKTSTAYTCAEDQILHLKIFGTRF